MCAKNQQKDSLQRPWALHPRNQITAIDRALRPRILGFVLKNLSRSLEDSTNLPLNVECAGFRRQKENYFNHRNVSSHS